VWGKRFLPEMRVKKTKGSENREWNHKDNVEQGDYAVLFRVLKIIWKRSEEKELKRRE